MEIGRIGAGIPEFEMIEHSDQDNIIADLVAIRQLFGEGDPSMLSLLKNKKTAGSGRLPRCHPIP